MTGVTDRVALAASLVQALGAEPFYLSITLDARDAGHRDEMLRQYFDYSIEEGRRLGRCVPAPDGQSGVAVWLLPADPATLAEARRAKQRFLAATLGPVGRANYESVIGHLAAHAASLVDSATWYLSIVGVVPSSQGVGLGAALLQPTLREADARGATCYLESFNPRNVRFYERQGFQVRASPVEPVTGSPYRVMVRKPRPR